MASEPQTGTRLPTARRAAPRPESIDIQVDALLNAQRIALV
jgi:hypothetical protein